MMERLPVEMLIEIGSYLSVADLSACSAVSRGWRKTLNDDTLWRRHCEPALEEHLRTTSCAVQPAFTSPEPEDSDLEPLCKWRLAYMRQTHLFNNWHQGRFVKQELFEYDMCIYECEFVTEDLLVIVFEQKMEIWNIKNGLASKVKELCYLVDFTEYMERFSISQNFIIRTSLYHPFVYVYHLELESMSFGRKCIFLPSLSEPYSPDALRIIKKQFWERRFRGVSTSFISVDDTLLVFTNTSSEDTYCIHVWNLQAGKKVKKLPFPPVEDKKLENISGVDFKKSTPHSKDVLVAVKSYNSINHLSKCSFFIYSTTNHSFTNFEASFDGFLNPYGTGQFDFTEKYLILKEYTLGTGISKLLIYNHTTNNLITTIDTDDMEMPRLFMYIIPDHDIRVIFDKTSYDHIIAYILPKSKSKINNDCKGLSSLAYYKSLECTGITKHVDWKMIPESEFKPKCFRINPTYSLVTHFKQYLSRIIISYYW